MCDATNVLQGPLSSFKKKLKLKKFEKKNVSLTMEIIMKIKGNAGLLAFLYLCLKWATDSHKQWMDEWNVLLTQVYESHRARSHDHVVGKPTHCCQPRGAPWYTMVDMWYIFEHDIRGCMFLRALQPKDGKWREGKEECGSGHGTGAVLLPGFAINW